MVESAPFHIELQCMPGPPPIYELIFFLSSICFFLGILLTIYGHYKKRHSFVRTGKTIAAIALAVWVFLLLLPPALDLFGVELNSCTSWF